MLLPLQLLLLLDTTMIEKIMMRAESGQQAMSSDHVIRKTSPPKCSLADCDEAV